MKFIKMHGLGNDYVYVDAFKERVPADVPGLARKISDRHFGVGGDGLVLICPSERGDARMRMFNADGSEAEMCGNAVRCVAKYVHDSGIARKPVLKIETGRGVLTLECEVAAGKVERVRVDMGEPILEGEMIPTTFMGEKVVNAPLPAVATSSGKEWMVAAGVEPTMTCVSMGNPHMVVYCTDVATVPLETVGPALENAKEFPRRINVHFVQVKSPTDVIMRTWERGSGITLACGTGAAAVCVAGVLTGKSARKITARLPGGDLLLEWSEANNHVFKTGPAAVVFSGEWPENADS